MSNNPQSELLIVDALAPAWAQPLLHAANVTMQIQRDIRELMVEQKYNHACSWLRMENARANSSHDCLVPLPTLPAIPPPPAPVPPLGPPPPHFPRTLGALRALTEAHANDILLAYDLPQQSTLQQKRLQIARYIGCQA